MEDKINRFADKDSHQIFLEPEGLTTHEFYPNGISTSLPFDIQYDWCAACRAGNAHILRPGYAIEYDYFDPRSSRAALKRADRACSLPGQINGTTGYEGRRPGACLPVSMPRCSAGRTAWLPAATRPTWACWWTT